MNEPSPITNACEQNFHTMISDGRRNNDWASTKAGLVDFDGDGKRSAFIPGALSMSDIATYYFRTDLSPLDNNVPGVSTRCGRQASPAQQSLTTLGLSYGVAENGLTADGCWPAGADNPGFDWGFPFPATATARQAPEDYMDLWHAAYNTNGFFSFVSNSSQLVDEISNYLSGLVIREKRFGQSAVNSRSVDDAMVLLELQFGFY